MPLFDNADRTLTEDRQGPFEGRLGGVSAFMNAITEKAGDISRGAFGGANVLENEGLASEKYLAQVQKVSGMVGKVVSSLDQKKQVCIKVRFLLRRKLVRVLIFIRKL